MPAARRQDVVVPQKKKKSEITELLRDAIIVEAPVAPEADKESTGEVLESLEGLEKDDQVITVEKVINVIPEQFINDNSFVSKHVDVGSHLKVYHLLSGKVRAIYEDPPALMRLPNESDVEFVIESFYQENSS